MREGLLVAQVSGMVRPPRQQHLRTRSARSLEQGGLSIRLCRMTQGSTSQNCQSIPAMQPVTEWQALSGHW